MKVQFNEIELRKLDLNLLLVFSALMREGSVAAAANRLYLGSSAVSMALKRLRDALGDPLFVRTNRGMEPTSRAQRLWRDIAPPLKAIERAIKEGEAFDPSTARLSIRFAMPDDLEFILLPRLLRRLLADAPGVTLVVRPSDFRTLLARLDDGDADLALSATPTDGIEARHRVEALHRETFSVLHDPGQVSVDGVLDIDTFLLHPHVLLTNKGDLHGPVDAMLAARGRARDIAVAIAHFPTAPFVLKSTPSFISMPSLAAHHFASTYGLSLSRPPLDLPDFEVSLAWHVRSDHDPAHRWFRALAAKVLRQLREETLGKEEGEIAVRLPGHD